MKKLKLSLINLEGAELLTRQQLKMVMGGSGDEGSGSNIRCSSKPCSGHDLLLGNYNGTCALRSGTGPRLDTCECKDSNGNFFVHDCKA